MLYYALIRYTVIYMYTGTTRQQSVLKRPLRGEGLGRPLHYLLSLDLC
jgi:hypothetical protein